MKYVFFDIECSDGEHICEFGYVLTDDKFNIITHGDITINPEARFCLTGRDNRPDVVLFYSEKEYKESQKFPFYYDFIKHLLENPNHMILGHAVSNDANFLNKACDRYHLPNINFVFNDSQKMYQEYFADKKQVSLEKAAEIFELDLPVYLHKPDDDSIITMNFVKKMCDTMEVPLEVLIDLCPSCSGHTKNGEIMYDNDVNRLAKRVEELNNNTLVRLHHKLYKMFRTNVSKMKPNGEIINCELTGKKVSISINYEEYHLKEMFLIAQCMVNHGIIYFATASESDCLVRYDYNEGFNKEHMDGRTRHVLEANNNGANIKIISIDEFLSMIGLSIEDLKNAPDLETKIFDKKKTKKDKSYISKTKQTTIGDLFGDKLKNIKFED